MSNKHLTRNPKKAYPAIGYTDEEIRDAWWYELAAGIEVYVKSECHCCRTNVTGVRIPWRSIESALKRKRKQES